jgi:hypothetical protein
MTSYDMCIPNRDTYNTGLQKKKLVILRNSENLAQSEILSSHIVTVSVSGACKCWQSAIQWRVKERLIFRQEEKCSRTPFIRTLVIRIGLALRVNLSGILKTKFP